MNTSWYVTMNSRAKRWTEQRIQLAARRGLHARPAQQLARQLAELDAEIRIRYAGREADATSILDLMTLAAPHGSALVVRARGPQAREALALASRLLVHAESPEPDPDEPAADR